MYKNPENFNFTTIEKRHRRSKLLTGLFVLTIGILILLDQIGIEIPEVLRSWELILIMIGLVILVKHNFKNFGGYLFLIVGAALMLNDYYPELIQMRIVWPSIIILFGISIIIKSFNSPKFNKKHKNTISDTNYDSNASFTKNENDYFESSTFFGSITKKIISEDFKGATITSVFGGTEIDLTDAIIAESAIIDITAVFSGITIVLPADWNIKSDLSSIFGGVDDKRIKNENLNQTKKTLFLKGTCIFGGIDLTSISKRKYNF
jgi:predicted membrane protein